MFIMRRFLYLYYSARPALRSRSKLKEVKQVQKEKCNLKFHAYRYDQELYDCCMHETLS